MEVLLFRKQIHLALVYIHFQQMDVLVQILSWCGEWGSKQKRFEW